ncbi:hypothetical protein KY331_04230 [Candidatus Woesearchaeota archaeon]|nr:hypothetical protein [Candidatus Woesearchaeota archaeon]
MIEALIFLKVLEQIAKEKKEFGKGAGKPTFRQKISATVRNAVNITRNAVDNTAGYGIAKYQNRKTRRDFKQNPARKDKIVYLMHGILQNEGSQWRLGKQLRKEGFEPYHLKGHHSLPRKQDADKAFEQIDDFQKDTKLKNPSKRSDHFSGHSSGADIGIYMAGDKRIKKYGIGRVQARAPAPYGIKSRSLGQKLIIPFAPADNLKKVAGKKQAIETVRRGKPHVPVDVVAGKYDDLIPPNEAYYKHANKHYVIDHPDSTHFGTSGGNPEMNDVFIDQLKKKPGKYKKAA